MKVLQSDADVLADDPSENQSPIQVSQVTGHDNTPLCDETRGTPKRKRRQWTIGGKISAISTFKRNKNKRQTAAQHGCTPAQLRKWLECEVEIMQTQTKQLKLREFWNEQN